MSFDRRMLIPISSMHTLSMIGISGSSHESGNLVKDRENGALRILNDC